MINHETKTISIEWCVNDVLEIRPDLTPEQAWIVLQNVALNHNAELGINWDSLYYGAEADFPEEEAA